MTNKNTHTHTSPHLAARGKAMGECVQISVTSLFIIIPSKGKIVSSYICNNYKVLSKLEIRQVASACLCVLSTRPSFWIGNSVLDASSKTGGQGAGRITVEGN